MMKPESIPAAASSDSFTASPNVQQVEPLSKLKTEGISEEDLLEGDDTADRSVDDEQPLLHSFPRKVSLISTPIDFRQRSTRDNRFAFMNSVWWSDANVFDFISVSSLVLTAVLFSYYGVNFLAPFLLAQSFKHALAYVTTSNTITLSKAFLFEIIGEFILFLFVYISTQAVLI